MCLRAYSDHQFLSFGKIVSCAQWNTQNVGIISGKVEKNLDYNSRSLSVGESKLGADKKVTILTSQRHALNCGNKN